MELEKITESKSSRRRYNDACGAAHALDIVGERWALLVIRELMFGPKRFSDIRASLPGISANVLTQRLEGLETFGVLTRKRLPPPASAWAYELTPWGYQAEPIFQVFGRWGASSPLHDPTLPLSAASILLSFRTMIDANRAEGFSARIGFTIGQEDFVATVADGEISIVREEVRDVAAHFIGRAEALAAAAYGAVPLETLEQDGALRVEGDRALARGFLTLFVLPDKAG
ncbi:winged helix-turn-helix transcriptional regulator [Allosphingosinicella vermicomposti]|uniref:winged helix-turn-helix transcriptional regulator n=1 Tax=Allosphingosinicella vermicomposti TaxID=614671 RepID=UPI000D0EE178|nr:helix-turn-helix domain-containing protein [Allosphingosinicella vermicomposti]